MQCPYCGSTENLVKDTAKLSNKIVRRRKCTKCQNSFYTEETVPSSDTALRAVIGQSKQRRRKPVDPTVNKKLIFVYGGLTARDKFLTYYDIWKDLQNRRIKANKTRGEYTINTKHLIIRFLSFQDDYRGKTCDEAFGFNEKTRVDTFHLPPQGYEGNLIDYIIQEETRKNNGQERSTGNI